MTATAYQQIAETPRPPRRSQRLREVAYREIKTAVLHGLLSGETPVVEERLAQALKISRTPVREALVILEHEGLLESLPYTGLFVKELTLDDYLSMYRAMETVEPAVARQAAERATESDMAAMEAILDRARELAGSDTMAHLEACRDFMRHLGQCAGNSYLTDFMIGIEEHADLYIAGTRKELPLAKLMESIDDRQRILDALRRRDPDAAAAAALEHARAVPRRWQEFVSSRNGGQLSS